MLVAACTAAPALAEIETRVVDGQVTFVSRPEQKPGPVSDPDPSRRSRASKSAPIEILELVQDVGQRYELDPRLITSVISVESGFNQMAVSPKGARGLMQLMPGTAREYGVRNVHDPKQNVEGGVAYLRDLVVRYNGDLRLALAAYNAGPEAVERASGVPNYPETISYLKKIEKRYGRSLAIVSMGPGGGIGGRVGSSIETTRDEDGSLVITNRRTAGSRVIRPPEGGKRR